MEEPEAEDVAYQTSIARDYISAPVFAPTTTSFGYGVPRASSAAPFVLDTPAAPESVASTPGFDPALAALLASALTAASQTPSVPAAAYNPAALAALIASALAAAPSPTSLTSAVNHGPIPAATRDTAPSAAYGRNSHSPSPLAARASTPAAGAESALDPAPTGHQTRGKARATVATPTPDPKPTPIPDATACTPKFTIDATTSQIIEGLDSEFENRLPAFLRGLPPSPTTPAVKLKPATKSKPAPKTRSKKVAESDVESELSAEEPLDLELEGTKGNGKSKAKNATKAAAPKVAKKKGTATGKSNSKRGGN